MIKEGFLKEHSRSFAFLMWVTDLAAPVLAAWVAFEVYPNFDFIPQRYFNAVVLGLIGFALIFPSLTFGRGFRGVSVVKEIKQVTVALASIFIALVIVAVLAKTTASYSRIWFVEWFVLTWLVLVGYRILLRLVLRWMRSNGFNRRSIVVVGSGEIALTVVRRIISTSWSGFHITGIFGDDKRINEQFLEDSIASGDFDDVAQFVQQSKVDQVWIAMPLKREDQLKLVMDSLTHSTVDIRYIPDIFGFQLFNHSMSSVAGLPVLNLTTTPMEGVNRIIKAIEDRFLAFIILLLSSPFMLFIALAIKLSSRGTVFYSQTRLGWNGKKINIYKFRTMSIDAERSTGPVWAKPDDERVTPIGRFLRRSSLDELPQFFNVLLGDMSIVGPRPERPVFVEKFKQEIPRYMKKHMVKAGITGWAQVNGWRGDTSLHERLKHDLYYIENWSILFDLKIIFLTVFRGFANKNAY